MVDRIEFSTKRRLPLPIFVLAGFFLTAVGAGAQTQPPSGKSPANAANTKAPAANASGSANGKRFSSPQAAAEALYSAAQNHDDNEMLVILGPDAKDIVMWTDDPSMRASEIDQFVEKYKQMHRLVKEPDSETTLYVGAENWPLPIPIVERNGGWYFDAALARREIMFRRIGENELNTVDTLRALVDAENDFYSRDVEGGPNPQYASRLESSEGKHDGLHWSEAKNMDDCPVGPFVAQASFDRPDRKPLHGYYYKVLTEQGPKAMGGARKYIVDGKMTGGFAFVAFPAEYRGSGVQTFIVAKSGRVYQKDLGPTTEQLAKSMRSYNPDSTWSEVR